MNPPPPSPATYGSVTPRVALAATAASIALPPLLRIPIAVLVASLSTEAAAPPVPVATAWDCAAAAAGSASATSRTTVATTRCPMPARYPRPTGTKLFAGAPETAPRLASAPRRGDEVAGVVHVRRDRQRRRIAALREQLVEHPSVVQPDVGERAPVATARLHAKPVADVPARGQHARGERRRRMTEALNPSIHLRR